MDKRIDVDLCTANKRIEIDYSQSAVKVFFEQPAKCGQDGKEFLIIFLLSSLFPNFIFTLFELRYIVRTLVTTFGGRIKIGIHFQCYTRPYGAKNQKNSTSV